MLNLGAVALSFSTVDCAFVVVEGEMLLLRAPGFGGAGGFRTVGGPAVWVVGVDDVDVTAPIGPLGKIESVT